MRFGVIGFVRMRLVGASAWSIAPACVERRNGIKGRGLLRSVVPAGAQQLQAKRRAAEVGDEVPLRNRLAPVHRVQGGAGERRKLAFDWHTCAVMHDAIGEWTRSSSILALA